jgi:hypothetical protein
MAEMEATMTWKAPPAEVICCPGGACSFGARPSSVELHRSAPRLTDVRRIAYEPAGPERLGRFCLSPFAEGRLMEFGTIGADVVHFGRHTEMRLHQLRRMLGRYIGID